MIAGHLAQRTWLHTMPARVKLVGLACITVSAFWIEDYRVLAAGFGLTVLAYVALGRAARARLKGLVAFIPFLVVIGLFQYWSIGAEAAASVLLRLCLMILLADMVSMTTNMLDMMDAIEPVLKPLSAFGLSPLRIAVALSLVMRFVPVLMTDWTRRNEAWRARTGRRASLKMLPSFLASTVSTADRIAEALDARGFGRQERR